MLEPVGSTPADTSKFLASETALWAQDPAWRHRAGVNQSKRTGEGPHDERADGVAA